MFKSWRKLFTFTIGHDLDALARTWGAIYLYEIMEAEALDVEAANEHLHRTVDIDGKPTRLGVDPNFRNEATNRTLLHLASQRGYQSIVETFLDEITTSLWPREAFKAMLYELDTSGFTPIHYMALNKELPIIKMLQLLSHALASEELNKAMIMQDKSGKTPLHYMTLNNERPIVEIIKLLRDVLTPEELAQTLTVQDKSGSTPLHYLVLHHKMGIVEVIQLLHQVMTPHDIQKIMTLRDNLGSTLLHLITANQGLPIIKTITLLHNALPPSALGQIINMQDKSGSTPLHCMILNQTIDLLETILLSNMLTSEERAKAITIKNESGFTLLHYISAYHKTKASGIIQRLNKKLTPEDFEQAVEIQDSLGFTLLHYMILQQQNTTDISLLLDKATPFVINATNNQGYTPLDLLTAFKPNNFKDPELIKIRNLFGIQGGSHKQSVNVDDFQWPTLNGGWCQFPTTPTTEENSSYPSSTDDSIEHSDSQSEFDPHGNRATNLYQPQGRAPLSLSEGSNNLLELLRNAKLDKIDFETPDPSEADNKSQSTGSPMDHQSEKTGSFIEITRSNTPVCSINTPSASETESIQSAPHFMYGIPTQQQNRFEPKTPTIHRGQSSKTKKGPIHDSIRTDVTSTTEDSIVSTPDNEETKNEDFSQSKRPLSFH